MRTWPHNQNRVNAGDERCDRVLGGAFRMWHEGGENDAVPCPYDTVPSNFDPNMPEGWLTVSSYAGSSYVDTTQLYEQGTPPPEPSCPYPLGDFGGLPLRWRDATWNPDWGEYVCVWNQRYPDWLPTSSPSYPNDPEDGWYYGPGWTSLVPNWPRDMYLELNLDRQELAETFRPRLLFDDDEHWRPLDVRSFFEESFPAGSYSTHHRVCTLDDTVCEEISDVDDLDEHAPGWYVNVTSLSSDDSDEEESDYVTPGCREIEENEALRDCDGGPTNAIYYDVNHPETDAGYTYIDYWLFYRYDDKDDLHEPGNDHEADLEGMTVAPSKSRPGTFDFASFAQHGTWWGYLRENLECYGEWQQRCEDDPYKSGTRINAYVATGSHATYPDGCSNVPVLTCGKNGQHAWMWEADHDGDAPWEANNDNSTLKPPDTGFWSWNGLWGEDKIVESPYWRSHLFAPRDENCAEGQ